MNKGVNSLDQEFKSLKELGEKMNYYLGILSWRYLQDINQNCRFVSQEISLYQRYRFREIISLQVVVEIIQVDDIIYRV